jgi:hypothetical protein
MTDALDRLEEEGREIAPAFAFVDPFGWSGAPLEIIARIIQRPRCECLITFMFDSINRFLSHPDEKSAAHFDGLFGTNEWRVILQHAAPSDRHQGILDLYQHQLHNIAKATYVRTFEMVNKNGRPIYRLSFATNNEDGLSRMKEAMWKADPGGGASLSDQTAHQAVLFSHEPDFGALRRMLTAKFRASGWVPIEEIEQFVRRETAFAERLHLRRATLGAMERANPPQINVQRPAGRRNRAGEYPPFTRIEFP